MAIAYNPKIATDGLVLCLDAANQKSYPGTEVIQNFEAVRGRYGI